MQVDPKAGTYRVWCPLDAPADRGMDMQLTVTQWVEKDPHITDHPEVQYEEQGSEGIPTVYPLVVWFAISKPTAGNGRTGARDRTVRSGGG